MMNRTAEKEAQSDTIGREKGQELAVLLDQHREEIGIAWAQEVHQLPGSHYGDLPLEELLVSTMRGLVAMVEALNTGSFAAVEAYLTDVSLSRLQMGFDIGEVIEALLLCKDAALPIIWRAYPSNLATAQESMDQLDACLRWMVGRFANLHAGEMKRQLAERQARTALMLEMAQMSSSTLELDEVLRRVARGIAAAAGVRHCGLFLVDAEQGYIIPRLEITVPPILDAATLQGVPSPRPPQPFTAYSAFLRQVIAQKEPLVCYDVQTDPRFDPKGAPRQLGFRSLLAAPLVSKGRVAAVAYALTFDECHAFTEEQIRLVRGLANAAALAIENARLYQKERYLVVLEERDRLSREMHDSLAQAIGALNLKAAVVEQLLSGGQAAKAQNSLRELREIVKEIYTDTREGVFSLRAPASPELDFFSWLQEYLVEYRSHYGVDARLVMDGDPWPDFPEDVRIQIMRIIQEALTNVRKHAGAARAWVHFELMNNDHVRISIEDNGRGFDLSRVEDEGKSRQCFGLQIMRERAESVGGNFVLDSRPGQGTRVVIRLPLMPGR